VVIAALQRYGVVVLLALAAAALPPAARASVGMRQLAATGEDGPVTVAKRSVAMAVIRARLQDEHWYSHEDPRVQAVVAGVPFASDFDPASLAAPRVPLALVTAGRDQWLVPRFHAGVVLAACRPRCELLADLPAAGHGALLSPPPPSEVLGSLAAWLLMDPPGFDRSQMAAVDARIAGFFRARLVP
jgi:hypothetical protein